jgi:hypothetical protein
MEEEKVGEGMENVKDKERRRMQKGIINFPRRGRGVIF